MINMRIEDIMSKEDKDKIHDSAIRLLSKHGFLCNNKEMIDAFAAAGCQIGKEMLKPKGGRVIKFTEQIINDALNKAPSKFNLYPTYSEYNAIEFGSDKVFFGTNASDMIWDLDTDELRGTTMKDFVVGGRIIDACDNIDSIFGFPCYWMYDVAQKDEYEKYNYMGALMAGTSMLHCGKAQARVYFASTQQELDDTIKLWQVAAGGEEEFRKKPCGALNVCMTSPYALLGSGKEEVVDWCVWALAAAKSGAVVRIEGSGLLCLSAPASIAGAITQDVAEFMAINTVMQTLNPGHPVVMSEYTGTADLLTGSKAAMRPEAMLVRLGILSMAKYYNKPSGWYLQGDAVKADAQAAWEHMATYLLAALSGVNLTMSAGGQTSADTLSFRQIVIDNEMMGWAKHLAKSFEVNEETIPLDLMMKVSFGPLGNHFLGEDHTAKHYKDVIWQRSPITNAYLRDAWLDRGGNTIEERSHERAKKLLKTHKPKISEEQQVKIRDYMSYVLEREKVKKDEAKTIMEKTYLNE